MSRVLFRIASVLIVLFDLGHTMAYPWSDPAWGVDLHALQSTRFDVLGSSRTYWEFYVGFGLSVSVFLLLPAVIAWQLGARPVRGMAWFLAALFGVTTLLNCVFFFAIPIAFCGAITLCLAAATITSPRTA